MRCDFGAVLNMMCAHVVLYQTTREKDDSGRISASHEDYARVRELIAKLVSEGVEATVPATIREKVGVAERLSGHSNGDPITGVAIARELKLDNSAALRRVRAAIDRGHLKHLEYRKGRPARIVVGDPLPEDIEVLPEAEALQGCTVVGESGG